jgi:hypothetical protein
MEHLPAYRMCLGNVCELDDPFTPLYKKLSDPFSIMFGFTSTLLRSKQVSSEVFNRTMALRPKLCERVFSRKAPCRVPTHAFSWNPWRQHAICYESAQSGYTLATSCSICPGDSSSIFRKSIRIASSGLVTYWAFNSYAGVFLLKAIFLNAVASSERRSTVRLLRRLIICLASTSSDVS